VTSCQVIESMPKMMPNTAPKTLSKQSSTAACVEVVRRCAYACTKKA